MKRVISILYGGLTSLCVLLLLAGCNSAKKTSNYITSEDSCSHQYRDFSSCELPKTCMLCGYTDSNNVTEHEYFGGVCKKCKTKQGEWEIRYKNDEFGQGTNEAYIYCEYLEDDDWDLKVCENELLTVTLENNLLLLKLYDAYSYGFDDYPEEKNINILRGFLDDFNITILDEKGNKHYTTGTFSDAYDAVIPDDDLLFNLLLKGQKIKIHLICEGAKSGFLFTFDSDCFVDVYNDYLTLTNYDYAKSNTTSSAYSESYSENYIDVNSIMNKIMQQIYPNASYSYEIDHEAEDSIMIRVYDPAATTTSNLIDWYYINKTTGLVYNFFNEVVELK